MLRMLVFHRVLDLSKGGEVYYLGPPILLYNQSMNTITPGQLYKHYKGHMCKILSIATHTETKEVLVIYTHPNKEGQDQEWARPIAMFSEEVDTPEYTGPRFTYIES
jgi:hypothetical protein